MKQCNKCRKNKPLTPDNFYQRKSGDFESTCKSCSSERVKKYYRKNKKARIKASSIKRAERLIKSRKFLLEYLGTHPCIDCGETNILTLEFDHTDPSKKEYTISWMVSQGFLVEKIEKEIIKCEVRCANCHKIKTSKQQLWYKYLYLENDSEQKNNVSS